MDAPFPLITIGITCFNAHDTIERAVRSALGQDWPNVEILIVDDCSSDNSVAIIENIISDSPSPIKLIKHTSNQGVGGARKTLVEHAAGEFIAFFDDDDFSVPERLSKQYECIHTYEEKTGAALIACYASGYREYRNGYRLVINAIGSQPEYPYGSEVADYLLFFRRVPGRFYGGGTPTCALMARKNAFVAAGNFDPAFRRLEDVDFAIRLALKGGHFIGCPEYLYVQQATSAPDKAPEVNLKGEQALAHKHREYLDSAGYYQYALTWPKIRYYHYKKQYGHMFWAFLSLAIRYPLKASRHIFNSGPKRLLHEWKMSRKARQ